MKKVGKGRLTSSYPHILLFVSGRCLEKDYKFTPMKVELSPSVKERYPRLVPFVREDKILSICCVDDRRCLHTSEYEEDYNINDLDEEIIITRVFTAFASSCAECQRNVPQQPEETVPE